jgi:hypothetical protein
MAARLLPPPACGLIPGSPLAQIQEAIRIVKGRNIASVTIRAPGGLKIAVEQETEHGRKTLET